MQRGSRVPVQTPAVLASAPVSALSRNGTLFALAAYTAWGFAPLYWKQLSRFDATHLIAHRILWSLAFALLLCALARQLSPFLSVLRRGRRAALVACGLLLGLNWWIFIWAVNHDRIIDTSLGYYLTPLLSVALGMLVFGERLTRRQAIAVALAAAGVAVMAWDFGQLPWISLALGGSFAAYGVLRKWVDAGSLVGFLLEMTVLALPALLFLSTSNSEIALPHTREIPTETLLWLAGCGVVTAFPLLCFASAAKRLPLSAVGIFQYLAPSLSLLLAVFLYEEPFTPTHGVTFALIWSALLLYSSESLWLAPQTRSG